MYLSRIALTNVRSMASLAIDFGAGPGAPAGTNRRWTRRSAMPTAITSCWVTASRAGHPKAACA